MNSNAKQSKRSIISELRGIADSNGSVRPASSILNDLSSAAVMSKLVRPVHERTNFHQNDENPEIGLINNGVEQISKSIMSRLEDNENIFKLFPDIELGVQIVVSSVLSPKDMVRHELIYRTSATSLPAPLTAKMVQYVHDEINKAYDLTNDLPVILRDALFRCGSHVRLVLPESAVDELINSKRTISAESIYSPDIFEKNGDTRTVRNIGFLGDPHVDTEKKTGILSIESIFDGAPNKAYNGKVKGGSKAVVSDIVEVENFTSTISQFVEVTDNFHSLKLPRLVKEALEQQIKRLTPSALDTVTAPAFEAFHNYAEEKYKKATPTEVGSMLYKAGNTDFKPFVRVSSPMNLHRKSVGRPLVMTIPSEAAIPVHVPGNPSEHIGYFVPTDIDGNPVTVDSVYYDNGSGISTMLAGDRTNTSTSNLLTEKARKNLVGDNYVPVIDHLSELYAEIIEADLLQRLSRGVYSQKLDVGRNNEIYRIMLSRTLAGQYTRLVYIPSDYITYFSFNYHRNGVGKSYLDDLSNITSLRAMVLFSKVMAKVKSSITTTVANIKLDERDRDPVKTIEMAKHLVAKARQQYFPHGLNRVVDLTDWIQRAGIEFTFENHPGLPSTSFNFESKNIQHTVPDDDLDEMLRYQQYMHLGLSPETVDSAAKADFATTVEQNSVLFSRRITVLSNQFSKHLTDHVRKLIKHDQEILSALIKMIEDNKGEIQKFFSDEEREFVEKNPNGFVGYVLEQFVGSIVVDLPKPESTRNASQKDALAAYEEAVDKALQYIISGDVLPSEIGGDANQYVENIKTAWKAALMRKWMSENNYTPEAFDITTLGDDGKPMADLLDLVSSYSENVLLNISAFIKKMQAAKAASDKDLTEIGATASTGGGSDTGSESDDTGGFGDDGFGSDTPFDDGGDKQPGEDAEGANNPPDDTTPPAAENSDNEDMQGGGAFGQ